MTRKYSDEGERLSFQVAPKFVESQRPSGGNAPARILEPSADDATLVHCLTGAVVTSQVVAEFVETKIGPEAIAATILTPSAEAAIPAQFVIGALVNIHVCAGTSYANKQSIMNGRTIVFI
jgi:hypothetical protein